MSRRLVARRREFLKLSGLAAAGVVAAACVPSATTPTTPGAAPAVAGPKTDTSRLTIAVSDLGKQNWRPWLATQGEDQIFVHVFDTLVRSNPETRAFEPGLAESWTMSSDAKTWTFKLRPNVPFHDPAYGTVTADDVKHSWQSHTQKDSVVGLAATIMKDAIDGDMKNFEIVSPLEFRLRSVKANPFLLAALTHARPGVPIQPKKYWDAKPAEAALKPIGTGPYRFVSSTPGVEVVLEAVTAHWRKVPAFKTVTLKLVTDPPARFAQVQSGAIDLAVITPALVNEAKKANVNLIPVRDVGSMSMILGGSYFGEKELDRTSPWIQADAPEKGLAIRQAMSLAIDRKVLLDKVLSGQGTLMHGPIVEYPSIPQLVDSSWKLPAYDLAQAKTLMARGGYPNGFDMTMMLFENTPGNGGADIGEAVAGMWEQLGIKAKRQVIDQPTFRPAWASRSTSKLAWARSTPYFDEAVQALQATFLPTAPTAQLNDPVITTGVPRLLAEPDATKRFAITREIIGSLIESVRAIPLFTIGQAYAAGPKIGSWSPMQLNYLMCNLETITPKNP